MRCHSKLFENQLSNTDKLFKQTFSLENIISTNKLLQKQVTLYILTRHDDMKDARFPLFSHSVGGAAEECSIVHGVVRCVSQSALATFTRCSHVGNSENNIKKITIFL